MTITKITLNLTSPLFFQISKDEKYIFCTCGSRVNVLEISTGKIIHCVEHVSSASNIRGGQFIFTRGPHENLCLLWRATPKKLNWLQLGISFILYKLLPVKVDVTMRQ